MYVTAGQIWRHKKRGSRYTIVGVGRLQIGRRGNCCECKRQCMDDCLSVTYRGEKDGMLWTRPLEDFIDGRFERLEGPPAC
jgi:hypothetical protein